MATKRDACSRLRKQYEAGSASALVRGAKAGCDFAAELARPFAGCREVPRSFTTKTGKRVTFTARVGDCPPRSGPTEKQLAARERFAAAARGEAGGPCGPEALPGCEKDRRATRIITPQGDDRAEYRVIDASELIPSHSPLTFDPEPRYPAGVQEREYQFDVNEQFKVKSGAQGLNPSIMLHRSPTAVDGPPLVTEDGCALGGNGRSMMLKLAYAEYPEKAAAYREALRCEANTFGLTQRDLAGKKDPVLVRVVRGTRCDSNPGELAKAVRRYNEGLTNVIDAKALGVSQARSLSPDSLMLFGEAVAGENTLRKAMEESPELFIRALENDRIITKQNRTKYVAGGQLTGEAKDAIEAMFVGRVLANADRIRMTTPAVLNRIEKAVPYLATVAGRNPDFDLTGSVQKAIDLVNSATSHGNTIENELAQGDMYSTRPTADVVELARLFQTERPTSIRERFRTWANAAAFDPRQGGLLDKPPTKEEAFLKLVENVKRSGRPIFIGTIVQQPSGLARVVARADRETRGPDGALLRSGEGVIEYIMGPRRGQRVTVEIDSLGEVVS
jgi:hypothetical protein